MKGDKEMEAMPGTKRKAVPEMLGSMAPTHKKSRDAASSERGTKDKKDFGIRAGILHVFPVMAHEEFIHGVGVVTRTGRGGGMALTSWCLKC